MKCLWTLFMLEVLSRCSLSLSTRLCRVRTWARIIASQWRCWHLEVSVGYSLREMLSRMSSKSGLGRWRPAVTLPQMSQGGQDHSQLRTLDLFVTIASQSEILLDPIRTCGVELLKILRNSRIVGACYSSVRKFSTTTIGNICWAVTMLQVLGRFLSLEVFRRDLIIYYFGSSASPNLPL